MVSSVLYTPPRAHLRDLSALARARVRERLATTHWYKRARASTRSLAYNITISKSGWAGFLRVCASSRGRVSVPLLRALQLLFSHRSDFVRVARRVRKELVCVCVYVYVCVRVHIICVCVCVRACVCESICVIYHKCLCNSNRFGMGTIVNQSNQPNHWDLNYVCVSHDLCWKSRTTILQSWPIDPRVNRVRVHSMAIAHITFDRRTYRETNVNVCACVFNYSARMCVFFVVVSECASVICECDIHANASFS